MNPLHHVLPLGAHASLHAAFAIWLLFMSWFAGRPDRFTGARERSGARITSVVPTATADRHATRDSMSSRVAALRPRVASIPTRVVANDHPRTTRMPAHRASTARDIKRSIDTLAAQLSLDAEAA